MALKLLVSVTGPEEAKAALKGGADIIDVKNPAEGSLGANFPWVIASVREILPQDVEMSATIGDLPWLPGTASLAALGAARCGASYIKAGILANDLGKAVQLMSSIRRGLEWGALKSKLITCGYADFEKIDALDVRALPAVAREAGCDGVLIDVREKREQSIFDIIGCETLHDVSRTCHKLDLTFGIAGGLGEKDVEAARSLEVDVLGVRSSVCKNGDRMLGTVDERLVSRLSRRVKGL